MEIKFYHCIIVTAPVEFAESHEFVCALSIIQQRAGRAASANLLII